MGERLSLPATSLHDSCQVETIMNMIMLYFNLQLFGARSRSKGVKLNLYFNYKWTKVKKSKVFYLKTGQAE